MAVILIIYVLMNSCVAVGGRCEKWKSWTEHTSENVHLWCADK